MVKFFIVIITSGVHYLVFSFQELEVYLLNNASSFEGGALALAVVPALAVTPPPPLPPPPADDTTPKVVIINNNYQIFMVTFSN